MLLQQRRDKVLEILGRYPEKRAALMPMLYEAQDLYGYLTGDAIREVAAILELDPTEVYAVSEFYSLYYHEPMGKYIIRFCTDMPCALVGAEYAYQQLLDILGVQDGETTPDGLFSVQQCVCLAACATAPVLQVNREFFENMTAERMRAMLDTLRATGLPEERPALQFQPRSADTPTGF